MNREQAINHCKNEISSLRRLVRQSRNPSHYAALLKRERALLARLESTKDDAEYQRLYER